MSSMQQGTKQREISALIYFSRNNKNVKGWAGMKQVKEGQREEVAT